MPIKRKNIKQKEQKIDILLPAQVLHNGKICGNPICQLKSTEISGSFKKETYNKRGISGFVVHHDKKKILVVSKKIKPLKDIDAVLYLKNEDGLSIAEQSLITDIKSQWLKPKTIDISTLTRNKRENLCEKIKNSWKGQFLFQEERTSLDGTTIIPGLRYPQIGALHATLAHWTVTNEPATIVMPTGTGKTETMLALLVCKQLKRLLVIVPTDALRDQISNKFLTLGVLKKFGVIGKNAVLPIVGILKHRLRTVEETEEYFSSCSVIVTTMNVVSGCSDDVHEKIADLTSHLFIDEAHHISAPTWGNFRRYFLNKTILQFTATPFRSDGKHVDGKIIYNYPLRKAQEEGYFKQIDFLPIREYNCDKADEIIALSSIEKLEEDLREGYDHLLMARASNIKRAEQIFEIYQKLAGRYSPQLIHSKKSHTEKSKTLSLLRERKSRIVVCVDMLGEGFDLPELKIAALHDIHKSIAITLQFTGRFTRTKSNIGNASMIANVANTKVEDSLRVLYAEDADWNFLFRRLSEKATGRQIQRTEFIDSFADVPSEISIQNIYPKMSTVVYQTDCSEWQPEKIKDVIKDSVLYAGPTVNNKHKVLLFVTREFDPIEWGEIKGIENTQWHLYLMFWDKSKKLLFINSSNKKSHFLDLAETVAGAGVRLIEGEQVYRCFSGLNRLILLNLGLKHSINRAVRFTMYVGADIKEGLSDVHLQNKYKSNIFGKGFENGSRASMGCSYKGRIWSYKVAYDISEWLDWCRLIGNKLLDHKISFPEILKNAIIPKQITERPNLVPLTIEWPDDFFIRNEDTIKLHIAGEIMPFFDAGIELTENKDQGQINFKVFSETKTAYYALQFKENRIEYISKSSDKAEVLVKQKGKSLTEYFQSYPPIIRFEKGAFLENHLFFEQPNQIIQPFNKERIEILDWSGTDFKKESQTTAKYPDSIQFYIIQKLLEPNCDLNFDVIFDDDGTNEIADIVAIKVVEDDRLLVHLYHCKYSSEDIAGARVQDLYAVCGQAQKSVVWKGKIDSLFNRLQHRELSRQKKNSVSRFERGDLRTLDEIYRRSHLLIPDFKIYIVQPGLSKEKADNNQLELLASTELYLNETYAIKFGVIASL